MNESTDQSRHRVAPTRHPELPEGPHRNSLLEAIETAPLVLDAGLGTRLMARGLVPRFDDPALWNLDRPEEVLAIHCRDVAAGAGAILTNTFGANFFWLDRFGRGAMVEPVNQRAVKLAREAAGPARFVIGDIGPSAARREGAAVKQAAILVDAGVDALFLETFQFAEAERILRDLRRTLTVQIPLLASLWEWPERPGAAARRLRDAGANVIGMNCVPGIDAAIEFALRLAGKTECPLLVKPSAGRPGRPEDEPAAFAAAVPRLLDHGVRLLGGCCGTSDAHVAALADACADLGLSMLNSVGGETY